MKLSTRLTLAMVGLVLLTATTVGYLTYRNIEALALPRALERMDGRARLIAIEARSGISTARADAVGFGAAVAAQGIVRSQLAGGTDPIDGTSESMWRDRMAARYVAELAAKPTYRAFSIVGLGDGGREIVRVDRSGPDGSIRVVPESELARVDDIAALQEASRIPAGDARIAPIDLSRRNGTIIGEPSRTRAPCRHAVAEGGRKSVRRRDHQRRSAQHLRAHRHPHRRRLANLRGQRRRRLSGQPGPIAHLWICAWPLVPHPGRVS